MILKNYKIAYTFKVVSNYYFRLINLYLSSNKYNQHLLAKNIMIIIE